MLLKTMTSLAFAATCLTAIAAVPAAQAQMAPGSEVVTNGPQGAPPPTWTARQNVIESHRYDRLVETSPAFRRVRLREECGPITDPQLHAQCIASFNQDEPAMYGSSTAPHTYRTNSGS
jgi:hypothetical protein